jgi:2-polyprenyl-3-methyl-5-hydroxy-6-metoxy-1,4-benzoquinol methylase
VSEHVSRGTILDYGCGTGMFLKTAKESGWKTFGIEPDESARKLAKEYNSDIYDSLGSLDKTIDNGTLSVITLWHVLEHVSDLNNTLDFFSKKLNEKGVLIIAVPNHISYDAKFYKEYWAAYDVPRHLYHFEKVTMEALLANHNFKLVQTKAMKFDSFYVSMLSEKYKTGAINYLAAFISGLRSNWIASSAEEYSSVIYIFKKDI